MLFFLNENAFSSSFVCENWIKKYICNAYVASTVTAILNWEHKNFPWEKKFSFFWYPVTTQNRERNYNVKNRMSEIEREKLWKMQCFVVVVGKFSMLSRTCFSFVISSLSLAHMFSVWCSVWRNFILSLISSSRIFIITSSSSHCVTHMHMCYRRCCCKGIFLPLLFLLFLFCCCCCCLRLSKSTMPEGYFFYLLLFGRVLNMKFIADDKIRIF